MKRKIVNIANNTGTFSRTLSLSMFLMQYRESKVPTLRNKSLRDIAPEVIETMLVDGFEIVVKLKGKYDDRPVYAKQWVKEI